jgi:hypothetical protein
MFVKDQMREFSFDKLRVRMTSMEVKVNRQADRKARAERAISMIRRTLP